jgi:hypothetical protein
VVLSDRLGSSECESCSQTIAIRRRSFLVIRPRDIIYLVSVQPEECTHRQLEHFVLLLQCGGQGQSSLSLLLSMSASPLKKPFNKADPPRSQQQRFVTSAKDIMKRARELYNKQPFRVQSDLGVVLMLPPQFADEIRNEENLSFAAAHAQVCEKLPRVPVTI